MANDEDVEEEIKKASAFWAGFDLDGRRAELDARALEVVVVALTT